jgi:hypothetical protein
MPAGLPGCKLVGYYQGAVEDKEVYDSIIPGFATGTGVGSIYALGTAIKTKPPRSRNGHGVSRLPTGQMGLVSLSN